MGVKIFDGYSPTHWVLGFFIAYILLSKDIELIYAFPILLLWELFEYIILSPIVINLKIKGTKTFPAGRDSKTNIMSDLIFGLIGVVFAYYVYTG